MDRVLIREKKRVKAKDTKKERECVCEWLERRHYNKELSTSEESCQWVSERYCRRQPKW